jgi:hypothetical protein
MTNTVKPGLYHKALGLPRALFAKFCDREWTAVYSHHAQNEARSDRYGGIDLPPVLRFTADEVVEVEVAPGPRAVKLLVRVRLDHQRDLVIALKPPTEFERGCFVKTVWINRHDDKHKTLNVTRYRRLDLRHSSDVSN